MMHLAFRKIPLCACVGEDVRVTLVWGKLNTSCGWEAVL